MYNNTAGFLALLKISQASLSDYEYNKTIISGEAMISLIQNTDINVDWLLTGKGKMIRQSPECDTCIYKVGDPLYEDPVVAELLTAARKILKSGNQVARDALKRNIEYFSKAIDAEKNLSDSRAELSETKKRLNGMEDRLAKLEEALSRKKCSAKDTKEHVVYGKAI